MWNPIYCILQIIINLELNAWRCLSCGCSVSTHYWYISAWCLSRPSSLFVSCVYPLQSSWYYSGTNCFPHLPCIFPCHCSLFVQCYSNTLIPTSSFLIPWQRTTRVQKGISTHWPHILSKPLCLLDPCNRYTIFSLNSPINKSIFLSIFPGLSLWLPCLATPISCFLQICSSPEHSTKVGPSR